MSASPDDTAMVHAPESPISLLLVDDQPIFTEVLSARLRTQEWVRAVEIAATLDEARRSLRCSQPEVILLDRQLDGELGLDLMVDLASLSWTGRVLMLSGLGHVRFVVEALEAGVHGWVSKTAPFETLLLAMSEVVRGNIYVEPHTLRPTLQLLLDRRRTPQTDASFLGDLSPRQLEVLRCLVAGMSRQECAHRLHLSVNTVRTHVQQILKRAHVHSTLALTARARALGVRGIDDDAIQIPHQRRPNPDE